MSTSTIELLFPPDPSPVHGHGHAGTAVAALGAVHVGQSGLHRVVAVLPVPDPLHRLPLQSWVNVAVSEVP